MVNVSFLNSRNQKISGILEHVNKDFVVIYCHGFRGSKNGSSASTFSSAFSGKISFFRFDFTGCGKSQGNINEVTVAKYIDDLHSAVKFLKKRGHKKIGLIGQSLGGLIVLSFAKKYKSVEKIVLINPLSDYKSLNEKIDAFRILKNSLIKNSAFEFAHHTKSPLLILHGTMDPLIPISQSRKLKKLLANAKIIPLEKCKHKLNKKCKYKASQLSLEWFSDCF